MDGRTDGQRWRRTVGDHNSSPWAFGSGELKTLYLLFPFANMLNMKYGPKGPSGIRRGFIWKHGFFPHVYGLGEEHTCPWTCFSYKFVYLIIPHNLHFCPKSIACSRDICNPKYDDHSFLSFYAKFGMNSFSGCGRENHFAYQNICNG